MIPEEKNPKAHHATVKGARNSLARKEISQESYAAVLRGELSLEAARELGRDRGPDDTSGASEGPGTATGTPRSASAGVTDAPQDTHRSCLCGCGQRPKSPKSLFVPGHDARLHGELKRQLRTDPLLRSEKFTAEQRRYAVERGLAGPEVLPEGERDG